MSVEDIETYHEPSTVTIRVHPLGNAQYRAVILTHTASKDSPVVDTLSAVFPSYNSAVAAAAKVIYQGAVSAPHRRP